MSSADRVSRAPSAPAPPRAVFAYVEAEEATTTASISSTASSTAHSTASSVVSSTASPMASAVADASEVPFSTAVPIYSPSPLEEGSVIVELANFRPGQVILGNESDFHGAVVRTSSMDRFERVMRAAAGPEKPPSGRPCCALAAICLLVIIFVTIFTVVGPRSFAKQLHQAANEDFILVNCNVLSVSYSSRSLWAYEEGALREECEFQFELQFYAQGIMSPGRSLEDSYLIALPRTDSSVTSSGSCGFTSDARGDLTDEEYFVEEYVSQLGSGVSDEAIKGWYSPILPDKCYRLKTTRYSYYKNDAEYRRAFECYPNADPYSVESACLSALPKEPAIEKGYMETEGWKYVILPALLLFVVNCIWASARHAAAAEEARKCDERRRCERRRQEEPQEAIIDAEGYIIHQGDLD